MPPRKKSENRRGSEDRRERIPFGVPRLKLEVDPETKKRLKAEGKVARWVKDVNNRIKDFQKGGYEFVLYDKVTIGTAEVATDDDRKIKQYYGRNVDGSAIYAYLMAIPEKWYKQDQAAKEEINKRVDDAIRGGTPSGLQNHGVSPTQGYTDKPNITYIP